MSVREKHSSLLSEAVDNLRAIDMQAILPEIPLKAALDKVELVWKETGDAGSDYVPAETRLNLRIALVTTRTLHRVTSRDGSLTRSDKASLNGVVKKLTEIAEVILHDPRSKTKPIVQEQSHSTYSPVGLRMESFSDLAGAKPFIVARHDLHARRKAQASESSEDDVSNALTQANKKQSKLHARLPAGQPYVKVYGIPVLATPKGRIDETTLRRNGIKYFRIPGAYLAKQGDLPVVSEAGYILLFDQLMVGLPSNKLTPAYVKAVIDAISRREGAHSNPLDDRLKPIKNQVLRSRGSDLDWLWLVPSRWITSQAIDFKTAAFPWLTVEQQANRQRREADEAEEYKSLKTLVDNQQRLGVAVDPKEMNRLKELEDSLSRPKDAPQETQDAKNKRLASQKETLKARVAQQFAAKNKRLAELKEVLEELTSGKDPKSVLQMKTLKAQLVDIKSKLLDFDRGVNFTRGGGEDKLLREQTQLEDKLDKLAPNRKDPKTKLKIAEVTKNLKEIKRQVAVQNASEGEKYKTARRADKAALLTQKTAVEEAIKKLSDATRMDPAVTKQINSVKDQIDSLTQKIANGKRTIAEDVKSNPTAKGQFKRS